MYLVKDYEANPISNLLRGKRWKTCMLRFYPLLFLNMTQILISAF